MWLAIGWLLGGSSDGRRLERALAVMGIWIILPWAASAFALSRLHAPWAGYAAGLSMMAVMLVFAAMPRLNRTKLALLEGLILWCTLALTVVVVRVAFHMLAMGILAGLVGETKWIGIGMGSVALAGMARWRIEAAMEDEAR